MGIAQSCGIASVNMDSSCEVRISRDGSVELMSAVQDLGTGTKTILAQIVGEEFGMRLRMSSSASATHASQSALIPAAASRPALLRLLVRNAAYQAKQKLLPLWLRPLAQRQTTLPCSTVALSSE